MTASIKVMLLEHKNIVVIIFLQMTLLKQCVINQLDHREYWGWRWDGDRRSAVVVTPKVTRQKKKQKQKQQQSAKPQKQN